MDETQSQLEQETKKWLFKMEQEIPKIRTTGSGDITLVKESFTNLNSYVSDCKYFQEQGDWVRAFEAIVYAWGIYETMVRLNVIDLED